MLVTLTKKNLQIISMESDSDSDSDRKILELNQKNKEIYNKLKELLNNPINEDSTAQIIELLDAIDPNNYWQPKSIELIGETKEIRQNKEIIKSIINIIPNIKFHMWYQSISPIDEILPIIEKTKDNIDSDVYNQFIKNIVDVIKNINPNRDYNSFSLDDILLIIKKNKKKIDNNVYNEFIKSIVAFVKNINLNTPKGYDSIRSICKTQELLQEPEIIKSIVGLIKKMDVNAQYVSYSIDAIVNTKELRQEPEIIKSIVGLIKNIDANTEYGYYSLYDILQIIEHNKKKIDDNVYNQFKTDIVPILKNIDPNIFYSYIIYANIMLIEIFDYLQAIKKIDMIVYHKLIKNIFNHIKNKECTDPKIQLWLSKSLMTDWIDNEKLIQKNKKLIQENEKLIQENEKLIEKNETLIEENKTLIEENKTLMKDILEENKTLMKNILCVMQQLNLNASSNECDTKELLDFMIDTKLIHKKELNSFTSITSIMHPTQSNTTSSENENTNQQ